MDARLEKQFGQLQDTANALFQRLEGFTDVQMNQPPKPEKWSAIQAMYHVMDAEQKSLMYLKKKTTSFDKEKAGKNGILEMCKSIALTAFLRSPIKVKAPKGVDTVPENMPFDELKASWLKSREEMRAFLAALPQDTLEYNMYKHPLAGKLSIFQAINFLQAHFNRHQKQIFDALQEAI